MLLQSPFCRGFCADCADHVPVSMSDFKQNLKSRFPSLYGFVKNSYYLACSKLFRKTAHEIVFSRIYRMNAWGDDETVSGAGSNTVNSEVIRRELPLLIRRMNVRSMLDLPCGDFFWMKNVESDLTRYIGADIVDGLVRENRRKFSSPERTFVVLDLLSDDIPAADLILCRDCLPHFSFADITVALRNIVRSGSKYFLTSTYPSRKENRDIETGSFRPLNLQAAPFNFPEPIVCINEKCQYGDGMYFDKSLALWDITKIPL